MTTYSTSGPVQQSNDADFRAWGTAFHAALSGAGFVQTADTGQVDWLTATRAPISTRPYYSVWRFNDSLQGSAPIFMRFSFGSGGNQSLPALWMRVGTGSDGSGNLTGQITSERSICRSSTSLSAGSFPTYACHTEGIGFVAFAFGSAPSAYRFFFCIARVTNSSGTPLATAALVCWHGDGSGTTVAMGAQVMNFSLGSNMNFAGQSSSDALNIFNLPGTATDTIINGSDTQATMCIVAIPAFTPLALLGCALETELPLGSTATITFIGVTPRTYIQLGHGQGRLGARVATADDDLCGMLALWE